MRSALSPHIWPSLSLLLPLLPFLSTRSIFPLLIAAVTLSMPTREPVGYLVCRVEGCRATLRGELNFLEGSYGGTGGVMRDREQ